MKKFNILLISLVALLLFGCSNKKAITYNEFKKISEKEEYTVVEVTEQFKEYDYIKGAYLAVSHNTNYQVELYLFEDDKGAESFYNLNKEIFESEATGDNIYTNVNMKSYDKYTFIHSSDIY